MAYTDFRLLEEKLVKQELMIKFLKWCFFFILTAAGAFAFFARAEATGGRWDGNAISLRDKNGRIRLTLDVKDDVPAIVLYDQKGTGRLELRLTPREGDPGILLYDENSKERARLEMVAFSSFLVFSNQKGEEKVTLAQRYNEDSYLRIYSGEKKEPWQAP